jgi:hypothetical protein
MDSPSSGLMFAIVVECVMDIDTFFPGLWAAKGFKD